MDEEMTLFPLLSLLKLLVGGEDVSGIFTTEGILSLSLNFEIFGSAVFDFTFITVVAAVLSFNTLHLKFSIFLQLLPF